MVNKPEEEYINTVLVEGHAICEKVTGNKKSNADGSKKKEERESVHQILKSQHEMQHIVASHTK